MEIIKNKIHTTNSIKNLHINKTVTKNIKIPDINLNAAAALRCRAYAHLTSAEAADGLLLYKGEIKLFFACDPDSEYIKVNIPLSDSLPLENESPDSEYKIDKAQVLSCSITLTPEGELSCNLNMILSFIVIKNSELEIITDIHDIPSEQTEKTTFTQCLIKDFTDEIFKIKNEFNLIDVIEADEIDEIENIYEAFISLKNLSVKPGEEGISVEGNALINITYNPKSKNNSVNFKKKVPFSKIFPLNSSCKYCNMNLSVIDDNISVKEDENGRNYIIAFEIDISASHFLICEEKITYISGVHKVNKKFETQQTDLPCLSVLCRNNSEFVVNEPVILDSSDPSIFQIYRINCTAVTDSLTPYQNKISAEGFLTADILYAAKDDENPVYSTDAVFPYKKTIELPGTSEADDICVFTNTAVKYADSKISDETNISIDAKISVTAYAFKKTGLSPITDITITDMSEAELSALPSMVLYIVKPGDSLLKIAEKCNSQISDIKAVNKIDDDKLVPGSKLLIVKPVM